MYCLSDECERFPEWHSSAATSPSHVATGVWRTVVGKSGAKPPVVPGLPPHPQDVSACPVLPTQKPLLNFLSTLPNCLHFWCCPAAIFRLGLAGESAIFLVVHFGENKKWILFKRTVNVEKVYVQHHFNNEESKFRSANVSQSHSWQAMVLPLGCGHIGPGVY